MPLIGFQFGFTGASGADTATLSGEGLAHTGQSGEQIFILGKLHLQTALFGLCPLGENIQDQGASIQHGNTQNFFQRANMAGGQFVIKHHHRGFGELCQHFYFLGLTLTDKAMGIGSVAVLENFACAKSTGSLQ